MEPQSRYGVRGWLERMQACVRELDYERARGLFAPGIVAFGTRAPKAVGIDALEHRQWREIWPTIDDFEFRLDGLHLVDVESSTVVAVEWSSLGRDSEGGCFSRTGRATFVLAAREGELVALHSHFSISPSGS